MLSLPLKLVFSAPSNQTLDGVFNSRGLYYKNFIAVINYDSSKLECLSVCPYQSLPPKSNIGRHSLSPPV